MKTTLNIFRQNIGPSRAGLEVITMANEDKKDFNAMLMDSKDMPKVQIITDEKSIEKYGGDKMYFAPPIDYDKVMRLVPCGKLLTVGTIRDYFAKQSDADKNICD